MDFDATWPPPESLEYAFAKKIELEFYKTIASVKAPFLIAVSGGADSVALLQLMNSVKSNKQLKRDGNTRDNGDMFSVVHVHHGATGTTQQIQFRDQAYQFVERACQQLGIHFYGHKPLSPVGQSEAELRDYRYECFQQTMTSENFRTLLIAHHKNDLLETRLIRMIRGTGAQGLESMRTYEPQQGLARPLLDFASGDLLTYLKILNLSYLEDPSNKDLGVMRNWMRHEWLPQLEAFREGAIESLARSVSNIISEVSQSDFEVDQYMDAKGVLRPEFLSLDLSRKKQVLASYMLKQGLKNYGLSHIDEIIKRLDVSQKELSFNLLKKRWLTDLGHLWCE